MFSLRERSTEMEALSIPPVEKRVGDDRRVRSMSSSEVDDWLKQNHISGGDRRKGQRRKA
jgi:hypothetical protein